MTRKLTALFLICLLLSGCTGIQEQSENGIRFYYLYKDFDLTRNDRLISPELREITQMRSDPTYVLTLYLIGPTDENRVSPLPSETRIRVTGNSNGSLTLELSEHARAMSDASFTLACACLTMTCLEIDTVQKVTVINGNRSITLTESSLTLEDLYIPSTATEETP